ncbi:hypothetical protein E2C01_068798 [Portunus trituberculatus]|uniref:Uncharacterized protein n=1 Tax=Portunus trituberculatus TaxID=210409 RepID=A0A5B7I0H5_PORTR|nr:hypothetical protein [Portunus trituberculatus]
MSARTHTTMAEGTGREQRRRKMDEATVKRRWRRANRSGVKMAAVAESDDQKTRRGEERKERKERKGKGGRREGRKAGRAAAGGTH